MKRKPIEEGEIEVLYGDKTNCMQSDNPLSVLHGVKVDEDVLEEGKDILRKKPKINSLTFQIKI